MSPDADAGVPPRFVLAVTVVFVLLCTAPYALAVRRTPPGTRFSGVVFNGFDQNYYQAAQRSTAHDLPRRNRFTAEPGAPGPVSPLYPLLGRVQRLTGLPATVVYHTPRVLAAALLPTSLMYLFSLCFPRRRESAMWAVLFTLFTTGLWTFAPGLSVAQRSGERIPESNALYSLAVFPHFALSYLGITLAFTALAMALRGRRSSRIACAAAGGGMLLALGHPFLLLPYFVVLVAFLLASTVGGIRRGVRSPNLPRLLAAGAVLIPAAPFVHGLRLEQQRLERLQGFAFPTSTADSWWTWAMGYGVVSILAVAGAASLLRARRRDPLAWLLVAWICVQAALLYLPFTVFQRRFSEGLIIPVAAVAAGGVALVRGSPRTARTFRLSIVVLLVVGAVLTGNLLGSSGQYVPDEVIDVLAMVGRDDIVLAGQRVSALLPALSDGTAHAGRPVETLSYRSKREAATAFARDPVGAGSLRWLRREGITMVVVLKQDLSFAPRGIEDPAAACLAPVLNRGDVAAYRVAPTCLTERATGG